MLTGVDVWAGLCVPSPVSAIRTPILPLLPLWEKGAGGMRGQRSSSTPYGARRSSDPVTTPAVCISSGARVESRTIVAHGSSGYAWMTCPSAVISSAACTIPSAAPQPVVEFAENDQSYIQLEQRGEQTGATAHQRQQRKRAAHLSHSATGSKRHQRVGCI
jgi:hypothetical protein